MSTLIHYFLLLPLLGIPLLIGLYVFRDARRRAMNAPLWTLIALLAPSFLGFILYLLVRSSHSDWKCPVCQSPVTPQYLVCPQCGTQLKPTCPACHCTVEPAWQVCPHCAASLPEAPTGFTPPIRHRDTWLGKILLAVVLVPLLLLVILIVLFHMTARVGAMNITYLTPEDYLEAKADHWSDKAYREVELWLSSCLSDPGQAYALRHQTEQDGQHIIQYLIYYPTAETYTAIRGDHNTTLLGTRLTVDFQTGEEATGYNLCTVSIYADRAPRLEVQSNGSRVSTQITDVSYSLSLFELLSQ